MPETIALVITPALQASFEGRERLREPAEVTSPVNCRATVRLSRRDRVVMRDRSTILGGGGTLMSRAKSSVITLVLFGRAEAVTFRRPIRHYGEVGAQELA